MAGSFRVTIDVEKIQSNVLVLEGAQLSEGAVRSWLRSVGFVPETDDGSTWLADAETIRRLDPSEIVKTESVA